MLVAAPSISTPNFKSYSRSNSTLRQKQYIKCYKEFRNIIGLIMLADIIRDVPLYEINTNFVTGRR